MLLETFTIKHDDDSTFKDFSFAAKDYDGDSFGLELIAAEDFLYIGLEKRFNYFYTEMKVANTNAAVFTAEYFDKDDVAFNALTINDETKGFVQSGFITFDRPVDIDGNQLWDPSEVDGVKKFWIRLKPDVNFSASTEVQGLNVVFSNDADLIRARSNIVSKHATNKPTLSWILKHVEARDEILQTLRNNGNRTVKKEDINENAITKYADLTGFDFHNFNQVRLASKNYALANIFRFEISDKEDDKYELLGQKFKDKGDDALNLFFLSLDRNADGIEDNSEMRSIETIDLIRD